MTTISMFAVRPLRDAWHWLRNLPPFRSYQGKHQKALEAFLDDQWARRLRRMNNRPVYTPPVKLTVDLPYMAAGSWSSAPLEVHHELPGRDAEASGSDHPAGELAPWVAAALANARADDTVIGPLHDRVPVQSWLEQVTGGDPFDGCGSKEAYVERLFAGLAVTP